MQLTDQGYREGCVEQRGDESCAARRSADYISAAIVRPVIDSVIAVVIHVVINVYHGGM